MPPAKLTQVVAATALIYVGFAYLWLVAANSSGVSDASRPLLKTICLVGAGGAYVVAVTIVARRSGSRWIAPTLLSAGGTVALGIAVIGLMSITGAMEVFFHDVAISDGLAPLLAFALVATLMSMLIGIAVGGIARRHRLPPPESAGGTEPSLRTGGDKERGA